MPFDRRPFTVLLVARCHLGISPVKQHQIQRRNPPPLPVTIHMIYHPAICQKVDRRRCSFISSTAEQPSTSIGSLEGAIPARLTQSKIGHLNVTKVTEDIEIQLCIHIKFSRARPRFHGSMFLQLLGHLVNYVRTQHRNTNLRPLEQDSVSAVKRTSSLLDFSDNEIRTDFELVFSYLNYK